jgi:hypothetical protein
MNEEISIILLFRLWSSGMGWCVLGKQIQKNDFYRGHPVVLMLYNKLQLKGCQTQIIIEVYRQLITLRATSFGY